MPRLKFIQDKLFGANFNVSMLHSKMKLKNFDQITFLIEIL